MVTKEQNKLTGVLNLDPKKDLPGIKLENQVVNGVVPSGTVIAKETAFGQGDLGSKAQLQLMEQAHAEWHTSQYSQYWLMERFLDFQGQFSVLLAHLAGFPYGLKEGDIRRSKNGQKRNRIVIDAELSEPDAELGQEDWVGPHRYAEGVSFLTQLCGIATEEGVNCQVVVHAVAEFMGKVIPRGDRSLELFTNSEKYQHIDLEKEPFEVGDVLFFHQARVTTQPASLHMAVFLGKDVFGMPWLIQATSQPNKLDPATEVVPLPTVFAGKNSNFFGAVRV
ncbi:MAG: hypothetical protein COY81_04635 [Candidatus Pacebacteria bacterium CG_4_10_14_0_8_um_filter_43_12]|nr:MAG: hypothetical protein COU66_02725 [Candidatus Pacebacteria bacterium CG10_big_fil_rev_8_21_14_0_10_44_11]PIY79068.1 MAG: hypothetical protein COY81_04635 [Candidatus Pacebacteria bacterium CG_4_10_14_0_8_um_filter_43_12]